MLFLFQILCFCINQIFASLTVVRHLTHKEWMLKETIVVGACMVFAYVWSKPTTKPTILHRAKRWEEFANLTFTFDCTERAVGFYADQEHHCQIFHMCDEDGRRIPYICANDTSFNQQYRICDWDYNVNCGDAQNWYYLNELTYVTDPPKPRSPSSDQYRT